MNSLAFSCWTSWSDFCFTFIHLRSTFLCFRSVYPVLGFIFLMIWFFVCKFPILEWFFVPWSFVILFFTQDPDCFIRGSLFFLIKLWFWICIILIWLSIFRQVISDCFGLFRLILFSRSPTIGCFFIGDFLLCF